MHGAPEVFKNTLAGWKPVLRRCSLLELCGPSCKPTACGIKMEVPQMEQSHTIAAQRRHTPDYRSELAKGHSFSALGVSRPRGALYREAT